MNSEIAIARPGGNWEPTTLGSSAKILTGHPFKSQFYVESEHGIQLLRGDNIGQGRLRWDGVKRYPPESGSQYLDYELTEGDVVLAMDRPWIDAGLKFARVRSGDLPCLLVQRVARLRGSERLDTGFLYYLIGSAEFTHHILSVQTGTAVPHISVRQIGEFQFPLPPLPEQQAIAHILGTLDDKIENNRRMNETLEAMAQALFKSWFVDFDPVRAKMEGRAPVGMDAETAALFPDRLVDSEIGEIPEGWGVGEIGDLAILDKSSVNPSAYHDEVFDHYSIPAFDDGKNPVTETGDQIKSNKFIVTGDCVLLTKLNPRIRRVWLPFPSSSRRSLCSTEFLVLKAKDGVPREFLFSLVSSGAFFEVYESMVTGTSGSHQRIRPEHLLKMDVVIPPEPLRRGFAHLVGNHFANSEMLRQESRSLAAVRDRLLPHLLSGEIRVGDAEEWVERVA